MDTVFLRDLTVPAIIGAYDWERLVRQVLIIDVEMAVDLTRAAADDDLTHALDYAAVAERITGFIQDGQFQLIETVADRLASTLMGEFGIPWIRLEVRKPRPLDGGHTAGVRVVRGERAPR